MHYSRRFAYMFPCFTFDAFSTCSPKSSFQAMLKGLLLLVFLVLSNKVMRAYHGVVVLVEEHLYGYSEGSGWTCQNYKTGKKVWSQAVNLGSSASVVFADGNLYGYHEKRGEVLLIQAAPAGYKDRGRFRIPEKTDLRRPNFGAWTHPVVANGRLYFRDQDLIFCYDVHK